MRAGIAVAAVAVLCLGASSVRASTVNWDSVAWDPYYGTLAVNGGDLDVTATHWSSGYQQYFGAAHYNTPDSFRAASGQLVQTTFIDPYNPSSGITTYGFLAFEQESDPSPNPNGYTATWGEVGAEPGDYYLYWWNEDTNLDQTVVLGPRTAGSHTVAIGKRADGTLDYYFDGVNVFSTDTGLVKPSYIGDVYLFSGDSNSGATIEFTSYSAATGYVVPEPISMIFFGTGLVAVSGYMARRRMLKKA